MSDFQGFDSPGTTATPDYVFDFLLKELTGNELKVLMYIIRRTFGFGKSADAISLSQFREGIKTKDGKVLNVGCGIAHNRLILAALTGLEKKGYVISQKKVGEDGSKDTTIYKLRFKKAEQVVTPSNEVVTSGNQGGSYFMPQGVVTSGNQQETHVEQETQNECVVSPTLPQPSITPTLSDDVAPDYTTSPTIENGQPSMQLSTQQASTVDNPQQSYSHRQGTSPATHVGVMPVLSVPMPPPIEGVKMPDAPQAPPKGVRQQPTPAAPRLLHTEGAIAICAMYESVAGPGGYAKWDWDAMEEMVKVKPTEADITLIYTSLEGKKRNVEQIWLHWSDLATLRKNPARRKGSGPVDSSYHPELETDADRAARDAKNQANLDKLTRRIEAKEQREREEKAKLRERRAN